MARVSVEKKREIGVQFGRWRLVPIDSRNWELFRYRNGKGDSGVAWRTEGRYYSYDGVAEALRYAVDCEVKARCQDKAIPIEEALAEYRRVTSEFIEAVKGQLQKG